MAQKRAPSMFDVFKNRSFTLLWIGQLISAMGSSLTALAASILVYNITGSALSVGLMLIATSGPTVLIGLVAGVFVDRFDRRRILLFSDLFRAILIFLIPFLIPLNINWLYVIVALTSAISQFFESAHASILPEVATDEELSAANALMAISSVASTTIGFAAAGILATSLNIDWAFYIDAFSFLLSATLILFTKIPIMPNVENTSLRAIRENLTEGLQTVKTVPILRSLFLVVMPIFLIFGFQNTLILPFSVRELNGTEFHFGLQQAAETVGITLGSFLMARLADRIHEGQWIAISFALMSLVGIFYSYTSVITMAIFWMGISGFTNAPFYIGRQLVIQRATPRELRGRVNSAFFVTRDLMYVLGMALAGLADIFNVRMLYGVSSYIMLFAGLVIVFMPGLGQQPAAEWKRMMSLLRGLEAAPRLGAGRASTRADIEQFMNSMKGLENISAKEREWLISHTLVARAPGGKIVVYRGELSDMAYFILKGSVGVGYIKEDDYVILNILGKGEFFGEMAALSGTPRKANIITEEECEFLILPSKVIRKLAKQHEDFRDLFQMTINERLKAIELPRSTGMDQELLRELRTNQPEAND